MKKQFVVVIVVFVLGVAGFIYFRQRLNQQNTNKQDTDQEDRESNIERIVKAAPQLLL